MQFDVKEAYQCGRIQGLMSIQIYTRNSQELLLTEHS